MGYGRPRRPTTRSFAGLIYVKTETLKGQTAEGGRPHAISKFTRYLLFCNLPETEAHYLQVIDIPSNREGWDSFGGSGLSFLFA